MVTYMRWIMVSLMVLAAVGCDNGKKKNSPKKAASNAKAAYQNCDRAYTNAYLDPAICDSVRYGSVCTFADYYWSGCGRAGQVYQFNNYYEAMNSYFDVYLATQDRGAIDNMATQWNQLAQRAGYGYSYYP